MAFETTIDGAGRLVIPKPLRERLGLVAGTRLHITEEEGRLALSPERPQPKLLERDGFLVVDLGEATARVDHREARDARSRELVEYALRR